MIFKKLNMENCKAIIKFGEEIKRESLEKVRAIIQEEIDKTDPECPYCGRKLRESLEVVQAKIKSLTNNL